MAEAGAEDLAIHTVSPYVPFPPFREWAPISFDSEYLDMIAEFLTREKSEAPAEILASAMQIVTRWAAVETGAIEGLYEVERGFTFNVAITAAAWSQLQKLKGSKAARAIEDAVRAYDLVLDATTTSRPITEVWIRELHAEICRSQETYSVITEIGPQERELIKGQYKSDPNSPLNLQSGEIHSYAPPHETGAEMSRLIDELRSELFSGAHPILQAAYAHYAFVAIHPFPDGNGRVSRALASVYLYRNPGVPLVIFADQSADYLNALEEADNGRPTSFVQFICERVADTVALVRAQMQVGIQPGIDGQMRSMQKELVGRGGLQHLEVDALADRLLSVFKDALTKMTTENPLMAPLSVQVHPVGLPMETAPGGYRFTSNQLGWSLTVSSAAPANASRPRPYRILVAQTGTETADFLIRSQDRTVMEVLLREVHPVLTTELVHRAEMIALAEYQSLVAEVRQFAAASLRQNGYQ